MKARLMSCLLVAVGLLSTTVFGCPAPSQGTHNVSGVPHITQSRAWYCSVATILMWRTWKVGSSPLVTQDVIWNWMATAYPSGVRAWWPGGGADAPAVAAAASSFLNETIYFDGYQQGHRGLQQAIADQSKGITQNKPTIVIVNLATHAVLVKGATWTRLPDAIQRPFAEFMKVHDPAGGADESRSIGRFMNIDMPIFQNGCSSPPCAANIQAAGQYNSGDIGYSIFNVEGGTYYGDKPVNPTGRNRKDGNGNCYWDPTDAGPDQCNVQAPTGRFKYDGSGTCYWEPNDSGPDQCTPTSGRFKYDGSGNCYWEPNDSGPDQCAPLLVKRRDEGAVGPLAKLWRWIAPSVLNAGNLTRGNASLGMRNHAAAVLTASVPGSGLGHTPAEQVRKTTPPEPIVVPHPYTTKPSEILANIAAVARQTNLEELMEMNGLAMRNNELRARRILDVKSLSKYFGPDYYLVELEDLRGVAFANVVVTKAGTVDGVQDVRGKDLPRALDLQIAKKNVSARLGAATTNARYVYAMSMAEPGSSMYRPLVAVETAKGTVYFNSSNEPFAEAGSQLQKELATVTNAPAVGSPQLLQLLKLDKWE